MALGTQWPFKDMGVAQVTWAGTSLGTTFDSGTVLKSEMMWEPIKVLDHGESPVDGVMTGRVVTLEIVLTRLTLVELEILIPGSTLVGDKLTVGNKVGCSMYTDADEMIIKPMCDSVPNADNKTWVTLWKTFITEAVEIPWDNGTQRAVLINVQVFPYDTSPNIGDLFYIGNN